MSSAVPENTLSPTSYRRDWKFQGRGRGEKFQKVKKVKEMYEAKAEFTHGWGEASGELRKKSLKWGGVQRLFSGTSLPNVHKKRLNTAFFVAPVGGGTLYLNKMLVERLLGRWCVRHI